jgi:TIR domain/FHA domain
MTPNLCVRLDGRDHSFAGNQDVKLGRGPGADVRSGNKRVSPKHAVLRPEGASWVLEDVGSLHGTFVDGERVTRLRISGSAPVTVWLAEPGQGQVLQLLPEGTTRRSGIFISYRRDDAAGDAGRLYDRLLGHFGSHEIFRDIDNISPGADFLALMEQAVGSCQVLLAVIGRNWVGTRPDRKVRRIDQPDDWVRLEVAAALRLHVEVIPVLVQKAEMPSGDDLPAELKPLARRPTLRLDDGRWHFDFSRLIERLQGSVGGGGRVANRWGDAQGPDPGRR